MNDGIAQVFTAGFFLGFVVATFVTVGSGLVDRVAGRIKGKRGK